MNDDEKQFEKLAVMLFFKRFQQGQVDLSSDRIPNFRKAVEAVQFDSQGEPIMDIRPRLLLTIAMKACRR